MLVVRISFVASVWLVGSVALPDLPFGFLPLLWCLLFCPFWFVVLELLPLHPVPFLPALESPIPDKVGSPAMAFMLPPIPAIPRGPNPIP